MSTTEQQTQVSDSVTLHTLISRPATAKPTPTLLLLHFWGGSIATWLPLIDHLKHEYAIVAPTLRGWGASSKPADPAVYSIRDYASDILGLVSNIQPDLFANGLVLVGHSMGGKIAQYLLTSATIRAHLRALVLLAPAPAGNFKFPTAEMREQQQHAYDALESAQYVISNILLGSPGALAGSSVKELAAEAFSGSIAAKTAWPGYGMGEDYEADVEPAVAAYREQRGRNLDVLVLVGVLDVVETSDSVQLRTIERLRSLGSKVFVEHLEGVGHLSPVEAPDVLAGHIDVFLRKSLYV